jgi:hypothetical protein
MGLGYVKRNLRGCRVENLSELLVSIQTILKAMSWSVSQLGEPITTMY